MELELSDWHPAPETLPAMRSLFGELRLYCPRIVKLVFVHNFERTIVAYDRGVYVIEDEGNAENFWREV